MTINLREIPELYREQVERFLTSYRNGQQIAEEYLAIVTSPEYHNKKQGKLLQPNIKETAPTKPNRDKKELIILGEITLNPGQSSAEIAQKTGMSIYCVRQRLPSLIEKGKITGFSEGKPGYYPVVNSDPEALC